MGQTRELNFSSGAVLNTEHLEKCPVPQSNVTLVADLTQVTYEHSDTGIARF